jgi:hypothetical protein
VVLDTREAEDLKEAVAMLPKVDVVTMVVDVVTMVVDEVTMVDEVLMVVVDLVAVGFLSNNSSMVDLQTIKEEVEDLCNSKAAVGTVVEEVDIAVVLVLVLATTSFHPMEPHQGNLHTPSCTKQPLYPLLQLHPILRLVHLSHEK